MEMEQELAKRFLIDGATLILLDVPTGTEIGIDMKSWNTGDKFLGVKMIPPGIHYVHYSAINRHGDVKPRMGFLHTYLKGEFLVRRWDPTEEEVSCVPVASEIVTRLKDDIMNIDRFLGVYPFEIMKKWDDLSNKINGDTVYDMIPVCGQIRSALDFLGSTYVSQSKSSSVARDGSSDQEASVSTIDATPTQSNETPSRKRQRTSGLFTDIGVDDVHLPNLIPVAGTELRLSKFPKSSYPPGSCPSQVTKYSLDSSYVLETVISQYDSPSDIISELQFTFICFLIGHSFEAFQQWKNLVGALCFCDESLHKYTSLYIDFFKVLQEQLKEIPEGFLVDIVANNNFIYKSLKTLFSTLETGDFDDSLKNTATKFNRYLNLLFGWTFCNTVDDEEDDDLPTVVDSTVELY